MAAGAVAAAAIFWFFALMSARALAAAQAARVGGARGRSDL